jgi:hypothetical protein
MTIAGNPSPDQSPGSADLIASSADHGTTLPVQPHTRAKIADLKSLLTSWLPRLPAASLRWFPFCNLLKPTAPRRTKGVSERKPLSATRRCIASAGCTVSPYTPHVAHLGTPAISAVCEIRAAARIWGPPHD